MDVFDVPLMLVLVLIIQRGSLVGMLVQDGNTT